MDIAKKTINFYTGEDMTGMFDYESINSTNASFEQLDWIYYDEYPTDANFTEDGNFTHTYNYDLLAGEHPYINQQTFSALVSFFAITYFLTDSGAVLNGFDSSKVSRGKLLLESWGTTFLPD